MLRIGFNGRPFCQDQIRGLGRHTLELIKNLKILHPEIEFYVYTYGKISDFYKKELDFVHFREMEIRPKILWDIYLLPKEIKKDKINIFHSTNNLGVPLLLTRKIPLITTIHDHFTHMARTQRINSLAKFWSYCNYQIEYFLLKRSTHFFTVSSDAKKNIHRYMNISLDKISVAYNGTSMSQDPQNTSSEMSSPYFLYVGGLEERKNIPIMLNAFIKLGTIPLKLVGNIQSASIETQKLIENNPNLFKLHSSISDSELIDYYQRAVGLIFPSKEEGFGLPLIEAMSLRCPVIASDIPIFREIALDAALYFSPHDQGALETLITKLINDKELRLKLIDKGHLQAQKFTGKFMAQTIYDTYLKVLVK